MNRQQRRKSTKKNKKPTTTIQNGKKVYSFTKEEFDRFLDKTVKARASESYESLKKAISSEIIDFWLCLTFDVLYFKLGLDRKELMKFKYYIETLADDISNGYVTLDELAGSLSSEIDTEFLTRPISRSEIYEERS